MDQTGPRPRFEVRTDRETTGDVLVCGFSEFGLAGLTAADYLVDQTALDQCGHVAAPDLPTITPFEDGTPRRPIRLFDAPDLATTVLMSEPVLTAGIGHSFADAVVDWAAAADLDEIVVLAGVPVAHGPDEHRTFYVATEDYREKRLAETDVPAMGAGFLDGVRSELVAAGMETSLKVGVYVTPVHPQAPDVEAALRLLETVDDVYGLGVDTGPLKSFASELAEHYQTLAENVEAVEEEESTGLDRMYM